MATVTITATEVSGWRARIVVGVADADPDATMAVERLTGSEVMAVMGGLDVPAGGFTIDDALGDLNTELFWRVRLSTGETATTPAGVTFVTPPRVSILSDPYRASWVEVFIEDWSKFSTADLSDEVLVEGDNQPVVIEAPDEVPRSQLRLATATRNAADQLAALTDSGRAFYLRPYLGQVVPAWLRSRSGHKTLLLSVWHGQERHEYDVLHVRTPIDIPATGNTQADLEAVFATQGDLEDHPTIKTQADLEIVDLKAMV